MAGRLRAGRSLLRFTLWLFALGTATPAWAAHVAISCSALGKELEVCRSGAEAWARKTGNEVEVIPSPSSSGERLSQMQLLLAAGGSDIDVFLVDTTWPGMLADFFVDLRSNPEIRARSANYFPSFIRNNTVAGRLVAVPWFIDAGVLYYRKDLLEKYGERPPATWNELTRIARKIQEGERRAGHSGLWGYVFQGRAYEGLTCNALEWIESFGGGSIVSTSGEITVNNPGTERALGLAASWIDFIAPRGVLNSMEEETRGIFQSGDAVFLRNWPYVWKLANAEDSPIRGKVGFSPLPEGEVPPLASRGANAPRHASTLGGWSLAVSRYSRAPEAAASLVAYLTSPEEEKRRALALGQSPTLPALYSDPVLLQNAPELALLYPIFENAVARPSAITGPKYTRVSSEVWEVTHAILSRELTAPEGLKKLDSRLKLLRRGGRW